MRKQRQLAFNDTDDHWVSTSQSTYTNHHQYPSTSSAKRGTVGPPYNVAASRDDDPPMMTDARAAWYAALGGGNVPTYHTTQGTMQPPQYRPLGADSMYAPAMPTQPRGIDPQHQKQRARTPPASMRGALYDAATTHTPQRRGRRMVVASRCTDDHIVFENTKYEDPADPLFYATHYAATDGVQSTADRGVPADDGGTDFDALINRYGFPGKQHTVARRRALVGTAQERSMNLFSRAEGTGVASPTARLGGPRRHLSPQPQAMSTTFQAVGDEVPFFRGGRRCTGLEHVYDDYEHTQRVLRTDKQEPPGPHRAHVRIGPRRSDELSYTLQGSAAPQRDTRRSFFEPRR